MVPTGQHTFFQNDGRAEMSTPEIVTKIDLVNIMRKIRDTMEAQKDYLSKTDTQIGDGDHGFNMSQGFNNVCAKMEVFEKEDIGGFLKKSGLEMIKTIGVQPEPYMEHFLQPRPPTTISN